MSRQPAPAPVPFDRVRTVYEAQLTDYTLAAGALCGTVMGILNADDKAHQIPPQYRAALLRAVQVFQQVAG